jgi:hypothetical protein
MNKTVFEKAITLNNQIKIKQALINRLSYIQETKMKLSADWMTTLILFKKNDTCSTEKLFNIDGDLWRELPDQLIEQIYYLILSELEEQKEKLEKEFEAL